MATDLLTEQTVNDLLNFDGTDDEDVFADNPITQSRDDKATLSPRAPKRKADSDKENDGLGLDEEVKITKKRKQIAKLDEERLLEPRGIPKLRQLARSTQIAKKLRFKGKGHEFSDVAKLLNYYQLWLDDLYPRAKFSDGLQIIEKVGHSKRMQVMRKEWIDEGKPGYAREMVTRNASETVDMAYQPRSLEDQQNQQGLRTTKTQEQGMNEAHKSIFESKGDRNDMFFPDSNASKNDDEQLDDDEVDALLAESNIATRSAQNANTTDSEGEDDLDALLAEQDYSKRLPNGIATKTSHQAHHDDDDDDDDLDALLAEQDTMSKAPQTDLRLKETVVGNDGGIGESRVILASDDVHKPRTAATTEIEDAVDDEDDDLDVLLAGKTARPQSDPDLPPPRIVDHEPNETIETVLPPSTPPLPHMERTLLTSSPIPNDIDDLDALFDEHEKQKAQQSLKIKEGADSQENFLSSPIPNEDV